MRNLSKTLALLLAVVLAFGLTGTALAADAAEYTDVPGWAKEYVAEMTEKGLIDGKTDTTFGANDPMTRADLVTALYRLAGSPSLPGGERENPFKDVTADSDCFEAVIWAYDHKIINGKTPDTFAPAGSAQRQEIAKIMCEFAARQAGMDGLKSSKDEMSSYPDAADVDGWAKDYMNWAMASGFITGSDGRLLPHGTATRAEVSAILCRYMADASTGDASKDNPRNQDEIGKQELLVVSFGTSFNDSRAATIKAVEDAMDKAFDGYDVRRAFTADTIIEHISRRDGVRIDNVKEALERAKKNGVEELLVQPTHLMNGYEYGDLVKALEKVEGDFKSVKIGAPLLTSDDDFAKVAEGMAEATQDLTKDGKTAVCWMGHGTEAAANGVYAKMQKVLNDAGYDNHFVGTVEAEPTAHDLAKAVKEAGYEKVILRPMMIVAGDHANNDMADEKNPESWYSVFTAAGLEVQCEIKGMGGMAGIQVLLAEHAKNAKDLKDTGIDVEPNPNNPDNKEEPKGLADGVYTIEVESDSSMFRVVACELTAKDGKMTAVLTLSGTGYDKMYAGVKGEAEKAAEGAVDYVEDADGKYTFTISVAALDEEQSYAAHAVKSGKWFDRTLTFLSDTAVAK